MSFYVYQPFKNFYLFFIKEAFGLENLYPQDWGDLLDDMLLDLNGPLVDKLYTFSSGSADGQDTCDLKCRKEFVCKFKQARSDNFISCD